MFYNMDNGQGLPQMIASISCENGRHLVHNQTRFIRARFAMSPLGSWWKERMPRSTKYIFCDEASQIDQKLDGRVENIRMTAFLTVKHSQDVLLFDRVCVRKMALDVVQVYI